MPDSSESDSATSAPLISLEDVTVRHGDVRRGEFVALDGITLDVRAGERVALLGPSGSGKTSLLEIVAGRLVPTSGHVTMLGDDPAHALRSGTRRRRAFGSRLGVIRQDGDLVLPLRVLHNVNAGRLGRWSTLRAIRSLIRPLARGDVERALERVGLRDRIDTVTGDLSGGERQRVAVARVLRQEPDVVLADEPTSSVDPALADGVMTVLAEPAAPWTLIVALHDPDLARRFATRLVGLRAGRVLFDERPDQVTADLLGELYGTAAPR